MILAASVLLFFLVVLPWAFVRFGAVHRGPLRPEVALTIDDGPNAETTGALLEALSAQRVPATFFCIGEKLDRQPTLGQAIVAGGHELANHSYGHAHTLAFWWSRRAERELRRAQAVLDRFGGSGPYFRAVAGVLSPPLYWAARRAGLVSVHWTASARDGGPFAVSDATALRRLLRGLVPGGILVIHDRAHAAGWIAPLKQAADSRGLRFVTLSRLLKD